MGDFDGAGICIFIVLVLLVLIAACYFMWRPSTSSASVSRCGYKQTPTTEDNDEQDGVGAVRLMNNRGGEMSIQNRKDGVRRARTTGHNSHLKNLSVDRDPSDRHRRHNTGKAHPWDHIGGGSDMERIRDRHMKQLKQIYKHNRHTIPGSAHVDFGDA